MQDKISKDKIKKYRELTEKALGVAKKSVLKKEESDEIIKMVSAYLSDSEYFEKEGDFVNAFAAINYAHGWLDSGARLGIFDVKDDKLFTIR
jgi:uncharacterized protein